MKTRTFGLDLAKRVFQVHSVDMETGEIEQRQLKRESLARFFAKQAPAVIGMEVCGRAHYWARRFTNLGHQVMAGCAVICPTVCEEQQDGRGRCPGDLGSRATARDAVCRRQERSATGGTDCTACVSNWSGCAGCRSTRCMGCCSNLVRRYRAEPTAWTMPRAY